MRYQQGLCIEIKRTKIICSSQRSLPIRVVRMDDKGRIRVANGVKCTGSSTETAVPLGVAPSVSFDSSNMVHVLQTDGPRATERSGGTGRSLRQWTEDTKKTNENRRACDSVTDQSSVTRTSRSTTRRLAQERLASNSPKFWTCLHP